MDHGQMTPNNFVYLRELLVFLLAAVIVVPVVKRFKASPIVGYLAVGAAIGPFGLRLIADPEGVKHLAEFGVVFLLFSIGLELSFERLRAMRRLVFGLGAAQVACSAAVIGAVAYFWGNEVRPSILIGAGLALSSTAMVMQVLIERREISSAHGRSTFAVLLFQDLAVVPILLLATIFAASGETSIVEGFINAAARALIAVSLILLIGRFVVRYLFRVIAWTQSAELFMALTLLAILSTALATEAAGLSMALGAFLAGLLLAETEYRHQVETDIQPFKGLLLALFFISVGMSINVGAIADNLFWTFASVVGLIVIKTAVLFAACLAFGKPLDVAVRIAVTLSAGGEFAFIILGASAAGGLIENDTLQFLAAVTALTMAVTPFLPSLGAALANLIAKPAAPDSDAPGHSLESESAELESHVVIAGFGRVGQTAAEMLAFHKTPYVALDMNGPRVRERRADGEPVYFGDASRLDVLRKAGAGRAAAFLVTLDDPDIAARTVEAARESWPNLPVYVRAKDAAQAARLAELGATCVVPEALESSLQLSAQLLQALGFTQDAINQLTDHIRSEVYATQRVVSVAEAGKATQTSPPDRTPSDRAPADRDRETPAIDLDTELKEPV
ncbi:MAG: monovalent cation:proton antiporter-2 (CPA2) family protein [Pseudomonadota bacterium]